VSVISFAENFNLSASPPNPLPTPDKAQIYNHGQKHHDEIEGIYRLPGLCQVGIGDQRQRHQDEAEHWNQKGVVDSAKEVGQEVEEQYSDPGKRHDQDRQQARHGLMDETDLLES
jgi:hypothetical protein